MVKNPLRLTDFKVKIGCDAEGGALPVLTQVPGHQTCPTHYGTSSEQLLDTERPHLCPDLCSKALLTPTTRHTHLTLRAAVLPAPPCQAPPSHYPSGL